MKKAVLILAAVMCSISQANAQWGFSEKIRGNGEMVTDTRNTATYDEVSLLGSLEVELIANREGNVQVEAESNLQEYILTEVRNNVLKISVKQGVDLQPSRNSKIKVIVPFEKLNRISLTGSGDIRNLDVIRASHFETSLTGSGDLRLEFEVEDLSGKITGSGDIHLRGSATNFDCKVTGSGDFKAYDLRAHNVEATVMGSGDIEVYASGALQARVMGSGDIHYRGNPKKEDFKTSGSGSVSSR